MAVHSIWAWILTKRQLVWSHLFECLFGPIQHFIHQINLSVFLWHIRTRVISATVHVLVVTRTRFVCWNMSPLFPLRSSKPGSKDTTFLTLISVSPFWLDPGLKSITHRSSSYHQTDSHKLINSLCCSYLVDLSMSPSLSPWKDCRQYAHRLGWPYFSMREQPMCCWFE